MSDMYALYGKLHIAEFLCFRVVVYIIVRQNIAEFHYCVMEVDHEEPLSQWTKKRKRSIKNETLSRQARAEGKEHVNSVGNLVPMRTTGNDCK